MRLDPGRELSEGADAARRQAVRSAANGPSRARNHQSRPPRSSWAASGRHTRRRPRECAPLDVKVGLDIRHDGARAEFGQPPAVVGDRRMRRRAWS